MRSVPAANAAIGTTASRTRRLSACHTASNPAASARRASSMPVADVVGILQVQRDREGSGTDHRAILAQPTRTFAARRHAGSLARPLIRVFAADRVPAAGPPRRWTLGHAAADAAAPVGWPRAGHDALDPSARSRAGPTSPCGWATSTPPIDWYQRMTPLQLLDRRSDEYGHGAWLGQPDSPDKPFVLVLAEFFPQTDPYRGSPLDTLDPVRPPRHRAARARRRRRDGPPRRRLTAAWRWRRSTCRRPSGTSACSATPTANLVEFSHDQGVYAKARELRGDSERGRRGGPPARRRGRGPRRGRRASGDRRRRAPRRRRLTTSVTRMPGVNATCHGESAWS